MSLVNGALSDVMMIMPTDEMAFSVVLIKRGDFTKDDLALSEDLFSKVKF